jgi:hypothetical protein
MKKYDKLNDTFNIKSENHDKIDAIEVFDSESNLLKKQVDSTSITDTLNDIKKDYEYTRGNLYSIIEKGQEAINGILELAQESEMPRAYEVAGQLIKNVSDAADKLMDLQKKLKDLEQGSVKGPTNVTNALFVGSTAELSKLLKSKKEIIEE